MIAGALEKVDTNQRQGIIEKLGLGALGPLLELGRTRIEEMLAEARKGGQVLSENITKPLADANKESDKLTKKIGNDWVAHLWQLGDFSQNDVVNMSVATAGTTALAAQARDAATH